MLIYARSLAGDQTKQSKSKEIRKNKKKFLTKRIAYDIIKKLCDERRKPGAQRTSKRI